MGFRPDTIYASSTGIHRYGELIHERIAFYSGFEVVNASVPLMMAALNLRGLHQLSFWDAMIIQAAREASCAVLLSEDLQTDATLSGVRIVNPLA